MIVFNLDHTLANCNHRNYFVDPQDEHPGYLRVPCETCSAENPHLAHKQSHRVTGDAWKPDWDGFDNACHRDKANAAACFLLRSFVDSPTRVEIWTGRSERVREKTIDWLKHKIWKGENHRPVNILHNVRMRPLDNDQDEDDLKMSWLEECDRRRIKISMAVESDEDMVKLWTERGIPCIKIVEAD